ncbi:MAG: hypothetical protein WDW38_002750 [Sanguina aurantia]
MDGELVGRYCAAAAGTGSATSSGSSSSSSSTATTTENAISSSSDTAEATVKPRLAAERAAFQRELKSFAGEAGVIAAQREVAAAAEWEAADLASKQYHLPPHDHRTHQSLVTPPGSETRTPHSPDRGRVPRLPPHPRQAAQTLGHPTETHGTAGVHAAFDRAVNGPDHRLHHAVPCAAALLDGGELGPRSQVYRAQGRPWPL